MIDELDRLETAEQRFNELPAINYEPPEPPKPNGRHWRDGDCPFCHSAFTVMALPHPINKTRTRLRGCCACHRAWRAARARDRQ